MIKDFAYRVGHFNEGALNMTFESYGYASLYLGGNMPMVIICTFVTITLWCLALLKGYVVGKLLKIHPSAVRDRFLLSSHGAWMTNFTIRFCYEVFLTVCVSVFISLNKDA